MGLPVNKCSIRKWQGSGLWNCKKQFIYFNLIVPQKVTWKKKKFIQTGDINLHDVQCGIMLSTAWKAKPYFKDAEAMDGNFFTVPDTAPKIVPQSSPPLISRDLTCALVSTSVMTSGQTNLPVWCCQFEAARSWLEAGRPIKEGYFCSTSCPACNAPLCICASFLHK